MVRKVNANQIAKGFLEFEISQAGPRAKTSDFSVEVYHGDASLFKFEDSTSVLDISSSTGS